MSNNKKIIFSYFSSVKNHVVPRYGSPRYIGVRRTNEGWDWDTERIVPIPENESVRYGREYNRALREGALLKKTEQDYKKYLAKKAKEEAPAKTKSTE